MNDRRTGAMCGVVQSRLVAGTFASTFLALTVIVTATTAARADLALDFTGVTQNGFQAEITFGWSFSVNQKIAVDGLGFFDDFLVDGQGLQQDHRVRIWTEAGVPVAGIDTIITGASTSVASTAADGEWLFNDIDSILLEPGIYVIGADDPAASGPESDRIRHVSAATTIPAITFIAALDHSGSGMPDSPQPDRDDGYFGPTFSGRLVPEPTSLGLLCFGLVLFVGRRRRRCATW